MEIVGFKYFDKFSNILLTYELPLINRGTHRMSLRKHNIYNDLYEYNVYALNIFYLNVTLRLKITIIGIITIKTPVHLCNRTIIT